jgi:UDP-N-acetylmuramate--alanine ligase
MSEQLKSLCQPGKWVHLIGIGGVGMSGLARLLLSQGLRVTGSDMKESATVEDLRIEGVFISVGHEEKKENYSDLVVYSSAISNQHTEMRFARDRNIPIFHRAQVLAHLLSQGIAIAVTGTHGKSTCSAMISFLLTESGLNPSCAVGGEVRNFGSNVRAGNKHLYVAEIDESDRSHLNFYPDLALITNLEEEHLDVYNGLEDLKNTFQQFVTQAQKTGQVLYCLDDGNLREVVARTSSHAISYGLSPGADFCAADIQLKRLASQFTLHEHGKGIAKVELNLPGMHNVVNALGVIALLRTFGLGYERFLDSVPKFRGVGRRLEVKLNRPELLIIDDYAHHPSEVKASLAAISGVRKMTTVVFQPHRFSRTAQLADEFASAFQGAQRVLLTEIYGAGEENRADVGVERIYDVVRKNGHQNGSIVPREKVLEVLSAQMKAGETIAFMGAGDIGEIANEFAGRFKNAITY